MKINKSGSSEVFDIYSSTMTSYLNKKAQAQAVKLSDDVAEFASNVGKATPGSSDGTKFLANHAELADYWNSKEYGVEFVEIIQRHKEINETLKEMISSGRKKGDVDLLNNIKAELGEYEISFDKFIKEMIPNSFGYNKIADLKKINNVRLQKINSKLIDLSRPAPAAPAAAPATKAVEPAAAAKPAASAAKPAASVPAPAAAPATKAVEPAAAAKPAASAAKPAASVPARAKETTLGKNVKDKIAANRAAKDAENAANVKHTTQVIANVTGTTPSPTVIAGVNDIARDSADLGALRADLLNTQKAATALVASSDEATKKLLSQLQDDIKSQISALSTSINKKITETSASAAKEASESAKKLNVRVNKLEAAMLELARTSVKESEAKAAKAAITPEVASGAKAVTNKPTNPNNPVDPTTKQPRTGHPESAGAAIENGWRQWLRDSAAKGPIELTKSFVGFILKAGLFFGVVGGLAALCIWMYNRDGGEAYEESISNVQNAINNATLAHKALKFNDSTYGEAENRDLLEELADSAQAYNVLNFDSIKDSKNEEYVKSGYQQLEELKNELNSFRRGSGRIAGDLASSKGWDNAKLADAELNDALDIHLAILNTFLKEAYDDGLGSQNQQGSQSAANNQAGNNQTGNNPSASGPTNLFGESNENTIFVYGEEINISDKPAGFRSAAPRMIHRLLDSPYGMAFIDPSNRWGGFIRKTGNPQVDYLNSLGYLYKEGIFTPGELRRFIRHALPKQGRRKHSAWNDALKFYRKSPVSNKTASNMLINENITKKSINRQDICMRKSADQYSNKYISDAISDLSDQYAKSYYAGLKSQYNTKPAKTDADYKTLYEVHGEKGSELVHEAHPNAIVVSDSRSKGGLVENLLEQKSRSEGVAKSAPTGNFRGRQANLEVIEALNKLANQADTAGFFEVSDLIDSTITTILKRNSSRR